MKKLFSFIFIAVLFIQNGTAQKFTHKSTIESVNENGFYQIHLPSALRKFAESNLRDLRITDKDNKHVPYLGNIYSFQQEIKGFKELKFTNENNSEFIIEKGDSLYWNSIILKVKSNVITKQYILSGSNDNNNWITITDTSSFTLMKNISSSESYQLIEFPKVDYQYIKLCINNSESEPLNIVSIGNITSTLLNKYFDNITPSKVEYINDTFNKVTTIHFQFEELQQIDKIRFYINSPSYFLREVNLHKKVIRVSKNRNIPFRETIALFELNSKSNLAYDVNLFEKDFCIEISNFDNQLLQIDSIILQQNPCFLVAELASNNVYQVQCGDKTLNLPNYDIGNLNKLDNANLPLVNVSSIIDLRKPKRPEITIQYLMNLKWFLWFCIAIGAIVLAIFFTNLMKTINNKSSDEDNKI